MRKQTQETLRESEERYRTLAENSGIGIWQVSLDGRTIYMNAAMCAILEIRSADELADRTYHSFFTAESQALVEREHLRRTTGVRSSYEAELVTEYGRRRNVMITGGSPSQCRRTAAQFHRDLH